MAKEVNAANDEKNKRGLSPFNRMLFSDLGADNSAAFVEKENALDKGGKPVHKYNMSSLGLIRKRTIALCNYLRWKIDWTTADIVMEKIPSIRDGDFIVKKVVKLPYRPGKGTNILKWFGQILLNPNNMYSEDLYFSFIRFMTERGMHMLSYDKDSKGRLISVTFDFTCIQHGGSWDYVGEIANISDVPVVNEVADDDETTSEEIPEEEIDNSVTDEGDETSESTTAQM